MNMKMLAERCGVSTATVSYALRNDPRISESVRKRIQDIAKEVGYRCDSLGSSLVAYRRGSSHQPQKPTVAVIFQSPPTSRRTALFMPHLTSFKQNLERYGYEVQEFYLEKMTESADELAQLFHSKGIRGIALAWGDWEKRLDDFPWQEFIVVSAQRSVMHRSLDRISMNHFSATDECFERLEKLGAKRIGLICHNDLFLRVKKHIVGAYLKNVNRSETCDNGIPPYFYKLGESPERIAEWFKTYKLDAVLSHRRIDINFFNRAGIYFPQDVQYAVIEIDDVRAGIESGVIMNEDFGQVLADTLAGKLHYNEHVDPETEGNLTLVDGHWETGETTRS